MLLVFSREHSYRALEKARELEAAFKLKYDPMGSAVERLPTGKEGVDALLSSLAASSLFSPRRFIRVDGLLTSCPSAKAKALVQSLERDVDSTIVVTVEEGELTQKVLKGYSSLSKYHHYEFVLLHPVAFLKWATEFASKQGVTDQRMVQAIADASQGNTWTFVNELMKCRAGGELASASGKEPSVYDVIDRFLMSKPDRWSTFRLFDDANAVLATVVNQARSLVLVSSGHTTGIHPYVAQKLSRMHVDDPSLAYKKLATAFVWSRTSVASADESIEILG